jgi:hypothetical protein
MSLSLVHCSGQEELCDHQHASSASKAAGTFEKQAACCDGPPSACWDGFGALKASGRCCCASCTGWTCQLTPCRDVSPATRCCGQRRRHTGLQLLQASQLEAILPLRLQASQLQASQLEAILPLRHSRHALAAVLGATDMSCTHSTRSTPSLLLQLGLNPFVQPHEVLSLPEAATMQCTAWCHDRSCAQVLCTLSGPAERLRVAHCGNGNAACSRIGPA